MELGALLRGHYFEVEQISPDSEKEIQLNSHSCSRGIPEQLSARSRARIDSSPKVVANFETCGKTGTTSLEAC